MGRLHVRQAASPSNVTECSTIPLFLLSDPPTTPPYSLMVYNDYDSMTRVYPLPVERSTGSWTVVYPAGAFLVYNIVDSEGKSVGNPQSAVVQATNGSTACLQPRANTTTRLEVSSDIVRDLNMCSPLNIRIDGGQKPYTVSLVPVKVAPTINITLGENDDSLFWVNLLLPNTTLVVTASDSKGLYGFSQSFRTSGNTVVTQCPGQVTHSFNSRDPLGQKGQTTSQTTSTAIASTGSSSADNVTNTNSQNDGRRTAGIVGGTVGAMMLLGLLFLLFRRRKRNLEGHEGTGFWGKQEPVSDYLPTPVPYFNSAPGGSMNQTSASSSSFSPLYSGQPTSSSGQSGVAGAGMDAISRKAARAAQEGGVPAPTGIDHGSGVQVRQHTDAMGIIELPPAYRDASPST